MADNGQTQSCDNSKSGSAGVTETERHSPELSSYGESSNFNFIPIHDESLSDFNNSFNARSIMNNAVGGACRPTFVNDSRHDVGHNNNYTAGAPDLYNMILQNQLMMQQMMFGNNYATHTRAENYEISDNEEEGLVDMNDNNSHDVDELEQLCASANSGDGNKDSLKPGNTDDSEILESLKDFLCSDETPGPKIVEELAKVVDNGMRSKAADEKIKTMLKKYSTPENCKNLIPPKTNLAIWKSLGPNTKKVDVALQRSQKLLCKGACPLVYSMDTLINKSKAGEGLTKDEVKEHLPLVKDAFLFIQMIFSGMNQKRREFIKNDLMPAYQALCSVNVPITDNLFGDDIDSKVKELDTAKKLGNKVGKMKNTSITSGHSGKPYGRHIPTLPSPRQFGMNSRFVQKLPLQTPQYLQVPFFREQTSPQTEGRSAEKDKNVTELHVSTCKYKLKLMNTKDNFCGGKISSFFDKWTKLTSDKYVLDIVRGYSI